MFLNLFSLTILILLFCLMIWFIVVVGAIPGKVAAKRDHPQQEAINVLGWIGLLAGGVGWIIALVWAYTKPQGDASC